MGKRSKADPAEAAAETVPVAPGPLAPWRLALVVALAAATTGMPLLDAAKTGVGLDLALLRSFGIAFLGWIALGRINHVLRQASADPAARRAPRLTSVPDLRATATVPGTAPSAPAPPAGASDDADRAA